MTRDEFSTKYKLLGLLRQGEGPTYSAEYRPTGKAVLVHFLPVNSPTAAMLPDLLARLGPADTLKIIETLTVEGSPVVVSGPIDSPGSFEQWLRTRPGVPPLSGAPAAAASSASPTSASSVIPAAVPVGGEFTQMFRPAEEGPVGREPDRAPHREQPAAPAASGSFTALFQPAREPPGAEAPPDASSVMQSMRAPAEPPAPATFTDLFHAPESTPLAKLDGSSPKLDASSVMKQVPPTDPPAPPRAGGSFTELFQAGAPGPSSPSPPGASAGPSVPMRNLRVSTPAPAEPPPAVPPLPPGPLAPPRMGVTAPPTPLAAPVMHSPDLPVPPPLVPRPAAGGANRGYVLPTMIAPEPHAAPGAQPGHRQGPSDFTRIVSGRAMLGDAPVSSPPPFPPAPPMSAPSAPPAAPPTAAEPAKVSYLPLFIVLNVVLILAVGLVLYFALKR